MRKKTRKILDAILWTLGIIAMGLLLYGIFTTLLK